MRTLSENGDEGLTQSALADLLSSDPNTIASLLERMERAEWIARRRDEKDGRAKRICLLPAGERLFKRARKIAMALQEEVLKGLSETRRAEFLEDLELVAARCRAAASK